MTKNTIKTEDFFNTDYVDYSSYDNMRKIASVVDGQKNSSRKILHTILEKNIRSKVKVSQLASKVSEFTEYLHGDISGVIVTLGKDYTGSNNLPLLQKSGNFGTRFQNDASASRYIHAYGNDTFFELFKKEDSEVLIQQYFEGNRIEPQFFVPTLPILLINGSEGLSSGYSQKILPRDPEKIKRYINSKLSGKNSYYKFEPFYKGFKGVIEQGENSAQWLIKGIAKKTGINKVEITEVPIGYDLRGYIKVLDTLEEKKVIQSYTDKSNDDEFRFIVNIASKELKNWTDEDILEKLKLIKKVTECYTSFDENNKIVEYGSAKDLMDKFIDVKMAYMGKRKQNELVKIESSLTKNRSKYRFIEMIVKNELQVFKRKKNDIVGDLEKCADITSIDGSYDYLLNMNIASLTEEKMVQLSSIIDELVTKSVKLESTSIEDLWLSEI